MRATTTGGAESRPSGAPLKTVGRDDKPKAMSPAIAVRSYTWLESEALSFNVGSYGGSRGFSQAALR